MPETDYRPPSIIVRVRRDIEEIVKALAAKHGLEVWWARNLALLYGAVMLNRFLEKNSIEDIPELYEKLRRAADKEIVQLSPRSLIMRSG